MFCCLRASVKFERLRLSRQAVKLEHVRLSDCFNEPGWATTNRCDTANNHTFPTEGPQVEPDRFYLKPLANASHGIRYGKQPVGKKHPPPIHSPDVSRGWDRGPLYVALSEGLVCHSTV